MQLVGPPLEETRVLSVAALFQSRTEHHLARPPLAAGAETRIAAVTPR
jgi:aspartyl-tRNA(Asn)/glutamyl-tRNA(Gln) amidotransferase subunit A